jgi:integrase
MASYQFVTPTKVKLYVERGYRDDGSRARKTKTVTIKTPNSERAAQRALDAFIAEASKFDDKDLKSVRFATFSQGMWWESHASKLHMKTRQEYKRKLPRLIAGFGKMKMASIRPYHIVNFFRAEQEAGRSDLRGLYTLLGSIFSRAEKWEIIKDNPVTHVDRPTVNSYKRPRKFYTREQMREALYKLDHNRRVSYKNRIRIKLGLLMGLREGEIAGILKNKVDFNRHGIWIDRQMQWDRENKRFRLNPIKNEKPRFAFFPRKLEEELRDYIERHEKQMDLLGDAKYKFIDPDISDEPLDLLFTSSIGRPIHVETISTAWRDFCSKNGLPELNFHGLRHSCLSYMLNRGAPIKDVQEQAGHSNAKITLNTYGHGELESRAESVNLMDELL